MSSGLLSRRAGASAPRIRTIGLHRLQFVVVPDISKPRAFDDALDKVDTVFHVASPMPGKGTDLHRDCLDPAVRGTLSIPESAKKAPSAAALDWIKDHKPAFKLVTIHPVFVLGPSLIRKTADDIDGINAWFWQSLQLPAPTFPSVIVDVRDVAELCIRAAKEDLPNGYELVASGAPTWEDMAAWVRKEYPQLETRLVEDGPVPFRVDNDVLGMKWRPLWETLGGSIDQQLALQKGNRVPTICCAL
ncbi:hypothetical protein J3F83DRAFT_768519 [Trichoderma novae-zelandiae]